VTIASAGHVTLSCRSKRNEFRFAMILLATSRQRRFFAASGNASQESLMARQPQFLFVTCQKGAEKAVKRELAGKWPDFHFAYSRPGFLTFKITGDYRLSVDVDLESVFARAYGFCIGKVAGQDSAALARGVWELVGDLPCQKLHVWAREAAEPGHPRQLLLEQDVGHAIELLQVHCPRAGQLAGESEANQPATPGDFVVDCIVVEPGEWWVGYHRACFTPSQWPGGVFPLTLPPDAVSRAWLKMEEALRWSQLPILGGARIAELGSAPGGASQALLNRGWYVLGVDPAEMHPAVAGHPRFTHIRRRAVQVRRREFRKVRWLTADMNVAPNYTLSVVEDIVTHPEVNIRGMLLTLKLFQWELADHIPDYLQRVRSWGYNLVQARQLQHNRQEICVAAIRR
jgi:23S rRNA (cytidine2498-2'-O)-methyltransferase